MSRELRAYERRPLIQVEWHLIKHFVEYLSYIYGMLSLNASKFRYRANHYKSDISMTRVIICM